MESTISIFDIYGVHPGANDIEDHPEFPQPRTELGDLDGLAEGLLESGRRDQPIIVWDRNGEKILLDGKRTVTAMLRNDALRKKFHLELPVQWFEPKEVDSLDPDQEAQALMIRVNVDPDHVTSGRKPLSLAEEVEAAKRLRETGLNYTKVGQALGYSRERARQLLNPNLTEEVKEAVGDQITEEKPLGREQALKLADRATPEQQREAVTVASTAVSEAKDKGQPVTAKMVGAAIGRSTKDPVPPDKRKRVPKKAKVEDVAPPEIKDNPQTPMEWLEVASSALTEVIAGDNGQNLGGLINHVRRAQFAVLKVRVLLEEGANGKGKRKAAV